VEDFGITANAVRDSFRFYTDHFDVDITAPPTTGR
jgi:hypothetical protein